MPKQNRFKIYHSRWQVILTLSFIILPFVFFLLFSRLSQISTTKLFTDLFFSTYRIFIAYIIAVVLGWVLAVSFYRGRAAAVGLPLFDVLQSFPTFAALPMAVYFWGASNFTVIFFLVITIIWPIFFSIISSLKLIRHDWQEVMEIFKLSGIQYLKQFIIPISIPGLITGSIIGLGEGWEALVVTEIIVRPGPGLGNFFQSFSHNPIVTVFGILGFLIFIFSINKLVWLSLLERSHRLMEG